MFKIETLVEWSDHVSGDPQSAFCALLRANPGARPKLLKSIQALAYLTCRAKLRASA